MNRFQNILMFVGREPIDAPLRRTVQIAKENGASLTLIDVVGSVPRTTGLLTDEHVLEELQSACVSGRLEELQAIADRHRAESGLTIATIIRVGNPAVEVVREVIAGGYDLLVKTASSATGLEALLGSLTRAMLRTAPCPVWALKPDLDGQFDHVLAAVDIEADDPTHQGLNQSIVRLAQSVAEHEHADLHVVTVWELWMERTLRTRIGDDEVDQMITERESMVRASLTRLLEASGIDLSSDRVHLHVERGAASKRLLETVQRVRADVLVMGTVCRTGIAGFLIGNTAEHLLSEVRCSVLAVKPEGFVSPVS